MQHLLLQQVIPSAAARLTARDTLSYTGFSQVCCAPNHSLTTDLCAGAA